MASSSSARVGGRPLGPAGGVPAVPEQDPVGGAGGRVRPDAVQRLGEGGGAGQVEAGEGEAGGGGVHMRVGERGGDQRPVEVDDLVDAVGEGVGGALGADPGDAARARRPSRWRTGRRGCGPLHRAAGRYGSGPGRCSGRSGVRSLIPDSFGSGTGTGRAQGGDQRSDARRPRLVRGGQDHRRAGRDAGQRADPAEQVLQLQRGARPAP